MSVNLLFEICFRAEQLVSKNSEIAKKLDLLRTPYERTPYMI